MEPVFAVPGDHIPHLIGNSPVKNIDLIFTVGLFQNGRQRGTEQTQIRFTHRHKDREQGQSGITVQIKRRSQHRFRCLTLPHSLRHGLLHQQDIFLGLLIHIGHTSVTPRSAHGSSAELLRAF